MSKNETTEVAETEVEDNTAEIRDGFDAAVAADKDEDAIKLDMISSGASFKNVTRLYNQFMIDSGLAISKADKAELVEGALSGLDFSDEEGFASAVEAIQDAIEGSTDRSAAALVRSYAKKNDLESYSKPKGQGGTRSTFRSEFYAFLRGNPGMTEAEATAYIMGTDGNAETSVNVQKHISVHLGVWGVVNGIYTDLAA